MGKIIILPDSLCNQIAAGEVVERPAAVVKELMENSIDAGSRKISVFLLQGGRKEIRVVDNGSGMSQDDALLALERHATSKIRAIEDLLSIRSLGFRGEAIPSIAAVSRFEIITKEPDAVSGAHIYIDGGVLRDVREVGCPTGTMITVRDLFHNVPARRKFLRSIDTEMSHIGDQFLRLALAHPDIHFQLTHEERLQYDFPQVKNIAGRAGQVLGEGLAGKLVALSVDLPGLRLHGLASRPELQRANGQAIFSFVNGRPVRDRILAHAILSAYDSLIPKGKFPVVVLFIEMSPELVDVNVHPTKREVRFRNPGEIIQAVRDAVRVSFARPFSGTISGGVVGGLKSGSGNVAVPRSEYTREVQSPLKSPPGEPAIPGTARPPVQMNIISDMSRAPLQPAGSQFAHEQEKEPAFSEELVLKGVPLFARLPVLGQIANTYLLLDAPDGLIIIDQHAAHERVIYDRLSSTSGREPAQRLTQSVVLDFLPREAAALRRWIAKLTEIGFELEPFGGDSFVISAVPAAVGDKSPDLLIRELLQSSYEEDRSPRSDILARLAKTAACHSAVRAGQKLKPEEIRYLLESLDNTRNPGTCPHGRPLWFKLTHADIARLFQRT